MVLFPRSTTPKPQAITPNYDPEEQYRRLLTGITRWLLVILVLASCLMAGYAIYGMVKSGEQVDLAFGGTRSPEEQQILQQQLQGIKNAHFLNVDLLNIRDTVLKQQWVDEVVVSRVWPKTIQIQIIPRQAVARWGSTGRWVSDTGEVFSLYYGQGQKYLPTLFGSVDQAKDIMRMYQEINYLFYPLNLSLVSLELTERMSWSMQFNNGLKVVVDQEKTMQKLQNFSKIAQKEMKPVLHRIERIDLRYHNGLSIKWRNAKPVPYTNGRFIM